MLQLLLLNAVFLAFSEARLLSPNIEIYPNNELLSQQKEGQIKCYESSFIEMPLTEAKVREARANVVPCAGPCMRQFRQRTRLRLNDSMEENTSEVRAICSSLPPGVRSVQVADSCSSFPSRPDILFRTQCSNCTTSLCNDFRTIQSYFTEATQLTPVTTAATAPTLGSQNLLKRVIVPIMGQLTLWFKPDNTTENELT